MTIAQVKASENVVRLQQAIGLAIMNHTMISPMTDDDVIAVLGFCAGAAIANSGPRHTKSELRQMCIANIDNGLQAFLSQPKSPLILPPHHD
jgi:hypothetical protein